MKEIKGFEGLYAVTSCGKVWSYISKKFLSPKKNKNGYLEVALRKNGKYIMKYIHRLVIETYGEEQNGIKYEVNHKDECKTNNSINNLEWCSHTYNQRYGTKIHRQSVTRGKKCLCIETGKEYYSIREAERQTGILNTNISSCCKNKAKTAGGYHWKYV
jgi:hypothetical protein